MRVARIVVGLLAALLLSSEAWACPLECTKEANAAWIAQYPATVQYTVSVSCPWKGYHDVIGTLTDSLMGSAFAPTLPWEMREGPDGITYPPVLYSYQYAFASFEACKAAPGAFANGDGTWTVPNVVNGTAVWHQSSFTCSANVVCKPPGGGATRTPGWWKNRVDALSACVAGGVDLGYGRVTTVQQALGLLWANEGSYSGLDKARLKLAKHTLVAYCNSSLLGGAPADFSVAQAVALLAGHDCGAMVSLAGLVDAFNNQFDEVSLPAGFDPGPSYGTAAKKMALAPVFPAGSCQ